MVLKLLTLLLVLTISLCSCAQITDIIGQLTGNGNTDNENNHSHNYAEIETVPTCTSEGYTTYICSCGDSYVADKVPSTAHNYKAVVTAPTCTTEGYTTYTCTCGDSYVADKTPTIAHKYNTVVTAPTCTTEGYTTYTCSCGDSYVADKTAAIAHNYQNGSCSVCGSDDPDFSDNSTTDNGNFDYSLVPEYSGNNYVAINGNQPYFTKDEITSDFFESYSELDSLGRVGVAFACLGTETLPTGDRGSLSHNPTGWVQKSYSTSIVPQTQIYNRSHLIAWSLSGEDNNKQNLMTGTPYFNQIGMQIFENQVLDYIRETGNHVMYRVTPVFVGDNLLANGVLMEGWSVEDNGDGICFCVFMYNVQPGVILEYETGNNYLPESDVEKSNSATLLTDASELKPGDKIIIVAKNANYAMGDVSSSGNNMVAIEIQKDGNTVYYGDDVMVITVVEGKTEGTIAFAVDGGYLYAASSSKNHLKVESTLSANSSWSVSITNGAATIKSTGSYTRNWLRFNSSNVIFSCYASGQQDICIFVVNE